jgi:ubiquinone/menaquinone biosynthesis C-methylase UbiE
MKVGDSGMPEQAYWNSLFDIPGIVEWLDVKSVGGPIVEIGCGYGTFTVPVARRAIGILYAFDIESGMLETAKKNASQAGLQNIRFVLRDILEEGTGLEAESVGLVLLFNILHFGERRTMIEEAARVLKPSGTAAIIHWRKDIATPRGPAVHTRPDQETILGSARGLHLHLKGTSRILEPYHWGIQLVKGQQE